MAIYTNYGRYLKAKQFKEMLEEQGDTYMVFGLGNPLWDIHEKDQSIPIAPYNTEIMLSGTNETNQFFDDSAYVYYNKGTGTSANRALEAGATDGTAEDGYHKYLHLCRRIIPPFPCIFRPNGKNEIVLQSDDAPGETDPDNTSFVTQERYQNYYIIKGAGNSYRLRCVEASSFDEQISWPTDTTKLQYFTELYVRGKALENGITEPPVGLLGAIKCNIDFVKDIGTEEDNLYTGDIDQFWYGDRYWQVVKNVEDKGIDEEHSYIETGDETPTKQGTYPHHIIFTATVSPRILCNELNIDQYLVPRQIGIYTKKRKVAKDSDNNVITDTSGNVVYEPGKQYYRAYENEFNFGQYWWEDGEVPADHVPAIGELLNFTLKCKVPGEGNLMTPKGEFKFLLNDYIRGQVRERHSIDRFGYVVSF